MAVTKAVLGDNICRRRLEVGFLEEDPIPSQLRIDTVSQLVGLAEVLGLNVIDDSLLKLVPDGLDTVLRKHSLSLSRQPQRHRCHSV